MNDENKLSPAEAKGLRTSRELETHLRALDTFTPAALGILAVCIGLGFMYRLSATLMFLGFTYIFLSLLRQ